MAAASSGEVAAFLADSIAGEESDSSTIKARCVRAQAAGGARQQCEREGEGAAKD